MFKNALITAFRNLLRHKTYSAINIIGLAVGTAIFLLISLYTRFEKSYEDFIPDRANIYRVSLTKLRNNDIISASAENYPAVGPALKKELPEVTAFARLYNLGYKNNVIITWEDAKPDRISLKQHHFLYADSSFLPMMAYPMLSGDAKTALTQPKTAVISEKFARLWFGNTDPLGKTLHMHDDDWNDEWVKVTGVFKDLPPNTHLKFDVLFSYTTLLARPQANSVDRFDQTWYRADMYTFVSLRPGADLKTTEARLPALIHKYKPQLLAAHADEQLHLQPLSDIHLYSDLAEEPEINGNGNIVFFLGIIGIFVLVIAWINFINLSTARAVTRAKEVGVRKVVGAGRGQLLLCFITEAALTNLLALVITFGLLFLVLPGFNTIAGLRLDYSCLLQPWFLGLTAFLWIAGTLGSGFYPAWVLSSFRPILVLKDIQGFGRRMRTRTGVSKQPGRMFFKTSTGVVFLRQTLVVGQFMASIALIAGTLIIYRQLHYMMHQDLGMDINQVVVMDRPGIQAGGLVFKAQIDLFRNELKKSPDIQAVTNTTTVPGMLREWRTTIKLLGSMSSDSVLVRSSDIDYEYLDVFKMQLLAGRMFSRDYPKDPDTSCILTASAARLLGFKKPADALGKTLDIPEWNNAKPIVVGVANDYHQVSLKKPLEPTLFMCDYYESEYYAVRVHTHNIARTIDHIHTSWDKAFPGNPFEYFFLDDYFNRQYSNDRKFGQLFTTFAILAILISCLGLFGLSAYMANQRMREISIRKVLGASITGLAFLLSKDFLKLVMISILLAIPLTWLVMHSWLQDFAYRTTIQWWVFACAGIVALLIALATVSIQAIRTALANPAKTLKSE